MKTTLIVKNIIKCKKCGDVIESKSHYDFVTCSCGSCSVDGGRDYLRRCGSLDDWEDLSEVEVIEIIPKYNVGDIVVFYYPINIYELVGKIVRVDVCYNSTRVVYDIALLTNNRVYKSICEEDVKELFMG